MFGYHQPVLEGKIAIHNDLDFAVREFMNLAGTLRREGNLNELAVQVKQICHVQDSRNLLKAYALRHGKRHAAHSTDPT